MSQHRTIDWTKLTVSDDQMTAKSFRFGKAVFVPHNIRTLWRLCNYCIFQQTPECKKAPCRLSSRKDGQNGYWWKHVDKLNDNQKN